LDQHVIGLRDVILEDRRAVPCMDAFDVDKVFYADGHAVQRPELSPLATALLGLLGIAPRFPPPSPRESS